MNKPEAKQLMTKYLLPEIEKYGYSERKGNSSDFNFIRKTAMGEDVILGGFTDYNPMQRIIYSFSKRYKTVIDILLRLQTSGIKLAPSIGKNTDVIGLSYCTIHGILKDTELPNMQTEQEVRECVGRMVSFMKETAFPLMEKFEDLREIDQIINGEEPWTTDYPKPYRFGGSFYLKRLIIARLASTASYDRILDFVRKDFNAQLDGEYGQSFRKLLIEVEGLDKLLAGVKPLY
jgi:hypothetical protein